MSSFGFADGAYNQASGTLQAFGALSDALVRDGYPPMVSVSGDREHRVQVNIFTSRFRQQATGSGAFGDVRYWDGAADGFPGGTRWVRFSSAGTVAVPGTGDHEARRSNDLAYPYDRDTPAHARGRELAAEYSIACDGILFREWWHWTFRGALGAVGEAGAGSGSADIEEVLIVNDGDKKWLNDLAATIITRVTGADDGKNTIFAAKADLDTVHRAVKAIPAPGSVDNTESNYQTLASFLQRAFKWDVRPKGKGASADLGRTVFDLLEAGSVSITDAQLDKLADKVAERLRPKA